MVDVIALVLTTVGIIVAAVGAHVSLQARKQRLAEEGFRTQVTFGEGLATLPEALQDHPFGMHLIYLGAALMALGGATAGIFTACCDG